MAYEFLRQHNSEPFTALYYDNEPSLPLESEGKPCRYREAPRYDSKDNIIGNELWRINAITETASNTMAAAISRNPPKNKSLQLQKVANPVGMES